MPEPRWWVHRPGEDAPCGPMEGAQVVALAGVDLETWVCPDGGAEWIPLGEIGPLRDRLRAKFAPPPVAAAPEKVPAGNAFTRLPAPVRLSIILVLVFLVLNQGAHFFLFRPLQENVRNLADSKNDETNLLIFMNDHMGNIRPPECPTPVPLSKVQGLEWTAEQKMDRTPWGEPWLYQCKNGAFRVLSPRADGAFRAVDVFHDGVVTVKSLDEPWPPPR